MHCLRNAIWRGCSSRSFRITSKARASRSCQGSQPKMKKLWKVFCRLFRVDNTDCVWGNHWVQRVGQQNQKPNRCCRRRTPKSAEHRVPKFLQHRQQSVFVPCLLCWPHAQKGRWRREQLIRNSDSDWQNIQVPLFLRLLHEHASKTARTTIALW